MIDKIDTTLRTLDFCEMFYNSTTGLTEGEHASLIEIKHLLNRKTIEGSMYKEDGSYCLCNMVIGDFGEDSKIMLGALDIFQMVSPDKKYDGGYWFKPEDTESRCQIINAVLDINMLLNFYVGFSEYIKEGKLGFIEEKANAAKESINKLKNIFDQREDLETFVCEEKKEPVLVNVRSIKGPGVDITVGEETSLISGYTDHGLLRKFYDSVTKLTKSEEESLKKVRRDLIDYDHIPQEDFKLCRKKVEPYNLKSEKTIGDLDMFKALKPRKLYDGGYWFKPTDRLSRVHVIDTILKLNELLYDYEDHLSHEFLGVLKNKNFIDAKLKEFEAHLEVLKDMYESREDLNTFVANTEYGFISIEDMEKGDFVSEGDKIRNVYNFYSKNFPVYKSEEYMDLVKEVVLKLSAKDLEMDLEELRNFIENECYVQYESSIGFTAYNKKTFRPWLG